MATPTVKTKTLEELRKEYDKLWDRFRQADFERRNMELELGVLKRILRKPHDRGFILRQAANVASTPKECIALLREAAEYENEINYCPRCGSDDARSESITCECGYACLTPLSCSTCRRPLEDTMCDSCRLQAPVEKTGMCELTGEVITGESDDNE